MILLYIMWSWNMTERLKRTGLPKIKMPVQMGDRVCLVYYDGQPTDITYPIMGNTLRDILISIDEGMRKPVGYSRFIDLIINNFVEPWRTELWHLYHHNLV